MTSVIRRSFFVTIDEIFYETQNSYDTIDKMQF